jgi:dynein heavy chain
VNPKRESKRLAEEKAFNADQILNEKKAKLKDIMDKIDTLKKQLKEAEDKKTALKNQVATCKRQLSAAGELIEGLKSEKTTWESRAASLEEQFPNILGETLVASGVIAYLGAFPMSYRLRTIKTWIEKIQERRSWCRSSSR